MSLLDYLFPVKLKDLEAIRISYEKAMDNNPSTLSVSFLWKKHNEPEIQRSFSPTKEEEDNR